MEPPEFQLDYILLPMGYSYNVDFQKATHGDVIRFLDGNDYRIFAVRKIKFNTPNTDILCRMRYGITKERTMQKWKSNALLDGHSPEVISEDECLWVVYDKNPL